MLLLVWALAGCSDSRAGQDLPGADTLTQRQRDSIIGASKLPGARSVERALDVSDSATARVQRMERMQGLDTIGEP
jgi:hypothetical protein